MPTAPVPLCAPPPPDLDWRTGKTPVSRQFDDIYFSSDGGLDETVDVFLKGCDLPADWHGHDVYTICELGFGTGLNFLATWDLWNKNPGKGRLHFISIEAYPFDRQSLKKALGAWPALAPEAEKLLAQWPGRVKGVHRLHFGNVSLSLLHMDVGAALRALDGQVNSWFLDGFSPAKNPDMWSADVFSEIAKKSTYRAKLATFTVAGAVRRGLTDAGFWVEKRPGFGRKRERLIAQYKGTSVPSKPRQSLSPVIIGQGIAGASIALAYKRRGIEPILIAPREGTERAASANPAALVMPRLDLQDRPESRFFLSAYLYAQNVYTAQGSVLQNGLMHIAKDAKEAARFQKIAAQAALPPEHMQYVEAREIAPMFGLDIDGDFPGLYFPKAMTIAPKHARAAFLKNCKTIDAHVSDIQKTGAGWQVMNADGQWIAEASHVHVCAGQGVEGLVPANVRYTSGQVCWHENIAGPKPGLIYGGYATAYETGMLLGASHNHVEKDFIATANGHERENILKDYEHLTGQVLPRDHWHDRASVRVTTRDTLPISYEFKPGLWVLSGLGSRGFSLAPLLGEAQVSWVCAEPLPLARDAQIRFGAREKS